MAQNDAYQGEPNGPIAYMASNRVAANLFMLGILAMGLVSLTGLEREAWPTVPFFTIEVSKAYPGATPDEVEESIVVKIEEEVRSIEEVKSVKSVAAPGMASVRVEVTSGTDMGRALDDIKSAVGRIQSFPGAAERAEFTEMTNRQSIIRIIVYGDIPERSLKELAHQIEDELATLPSVSYVETTGARNYEISIEVPLDRLRALGLTLEDVAGVVRSGSLELSAGSIDTRDAQVRVRTWAGATTSRTSRTSSCSAAATVPSCAWATSPGCGTISRTPTWSSATRASRASSWRSIEPTANRSWTWPLP